MNRKHLNALTDLIALILIVFQISCGGGKDEQEIELEPCAELGGQALYDQLALLDGTWLMDSIKLDEGPLIQSLSSEEVILVFDMDLEECSDSYFSISGGDYLLDDATNEAFSFVKNTDFLRMNLGRHVVQIGFLEKDRLVFYMHYQDPDEGRKVGYGEYTLYFSKQE